MGHSKRGSPIPYNDTARTRLLDTQDVQYYSSKELCDYYCCSLDSPLNIITGSLLSVLDSICVYYYEIKSCGVELELLS